MTNEELILQKLERIESQIEPVIKYGNSLNELKNDIIPLGNTAVHMITEELQDIEAGFQLEDFLHLIKQSLRSTNDFTFALKQMSNIIEFMNDFEPLLKSAVPLIIEYFDQLEQNGVFRMMQAMIDIRAKVASQYSEDDIEAIGDAMVALLGMAKKISDPKAIALIEKVAEIPAKVDLADTKKVGPFRLMGAIFNSEMKEGLGVALELTKVLGTLKDNGAEKSE